MTAESTVHDEVRARVAELTTSFPPRSTEPLEFQRARFDAGLAWVHVPIGLGGLGLSRSLQGYVEELLASAEAPDNPARRIGIGLGMAGPTILAYGTELP